MLLPISGPAECLAGALSLAARAGLLGCVQMLVAALGPNAEFSESLSLAAAHGEIECVNFLASSSTEEARSLALESAARAGQVECAKLLLAMPRSEGASNALQAAATHGRVDCARLLAPLCELDKNPLPFHLAMQAGQAGVVALMLDFVPSLIDLIDLRQCIVETASMGHRELTALLGSISESRSISAAAHAPQAPLPPPAKRL